MAQRLMSLFLIFIFLLTTVISARSFFSFKAERKAFSSDNSHSFMKDSKINELPKGALTFFSPLFSLGVERTIEVGGLFGDALSIGFHSILTTGKGVTAFVDQTVSSADLLGESLGQVVASVYMSRKNNLPEYEYAVNPKKENEESDENFGYRVGSQILGQIKSAKDAFLQKIANTFEPLER